MFVFRWSCAMKKNRANWILPQNVYFDKHINFQITFSCVYLCPVYTTQNLFAKQSMKQLEWAKIYAEIAAARLDTLEEYSYDHYR